MSTPWRRRATVALTAIAAACATGVSIGWWAGPGLGSAAGVIADPISLTLSPATPTTALYPGSTGDLAVAITNPNPGPLRVTMLALDATHGNGGFAVDPEHASAGCTAPALGYVAQDNAGAGWTIPASATLTLDLPGSVSLGTASASSCQGATFSVYLRVAP